MALKPQDVMVLLKLALHRKAPWTYTSLAHDLGISPSEAHAAVRRAIRVGLLDQDGRQPNRKALLEFIVHGLKYVFAAERGRLTRGVPTAHAAPPLASEITADTDPPPVWPDPEGSTRGETFEPLYRSAPQAAQRDPELYECLALIDAIRGGRARERKLAEELLTKKLAA